jgi:hypothetical protein
MASIKRRNLNPGDSLKYVAYFDFLGFRNWLRTEGSAAVFDTVVYILGLAVKGSLPNATVRPDMSVVVGRSRVRHANFSDTVIFYTTDTSYSSLKALMRTCVDFMALAPDIHMVRGAIAKGPFRVFLADSVHLGEALLDACDLAEAQDWMGVTLHQSMKGDPPTEKYRTEYPKCLVEYPTPLKSGTYDSYCINWLDKTVSSWSYFPSVQLDKCRDKAIQSASDYPEEVAKITNRILNTRRFLTVFAPEEMSLTNRCS